MIELKAPNKSDLTDTAQSDRVLVLCKDGHIGLWMVRSLGQNGLKAFAVCETAQGLAAHSRYACGAWAGNVNAPAPTDIDEIEKLAQRLRVGSIMPLSEPCHLALMAERARFEPDVHLFSPPDDAFAKAIDKDYLHDLCVRLGVPVAEGTTLKKLVEAGGDSLRFPVALRTRRQNGKYAQQRAPWGRIAYADDAFQLRRLYETVEGFADNIIVQEFHPGVTDQAQVIMHDGRAFVCEFIAETHIPLAGGVSVQRTTLRRESLIRDSIGLLKAIGWEGAAGVQFHYDHDSGNYIFIEINPRFVGGLPTMVRAGFHAPFLLWQSYFDPDNMKQPSYRLGLRSRGVRPATGWLRAIIRGDQLPPGEKQLSKLGASAHFLWHCGPWTKDDTFLMTDLGPFRAECRSMLSNIWRRFRSMCDIFRRYLS